MMDFNMEWNSICLVCLQEGEMQSLFDDESKQLNLCHKLMQCSPIVVKKGMNLPEQICTKCVADLEVAYQFRTNCESSEAILKSFVELNDTNVIVNSESGKVYSFRPPSGLNVRRVVKNQPFIKEEPADSDEDSTIVIEKDDHDTTLEDGDAYFEEINEFEYVDDEESGIQEIHVMEQNNEQFIISSNIPDPQELLPVSQESFESQPIEYNTTELIYKPDDVESIETPEVLHIKPVKTNKARLQPFATKAKSILTETVQTNADGTQVIRIRRLFDEPKPMKVCEICGNQYKYQHALDSHMRRHRNEKPFACELCGKGFVINFELSRHMRTHTGQKPYSCKYCDRKFSDFGSRIKHERTHTGERPYKCGTCGKTFAYSHVLSSHNLIHTGEKKYHCEKCGKRFTKSHHLKAHLNTHEKVKTVKFVQTQSPNLVTPERAYRDVMTLLTATKVEKITQPDYIIDDVEEGNSLDVNNLECEFDEQKAMLMNFDTESPEN